MNIEKLKKSKKGFTLVEIIVVLVIIAILAAIAIPAMTGWIDRANEKTVLAEARTVLLAAQTIASEQYGVDGLVLVEDIDTDKVELLAGVAADTVSGIAVTESGQITEVVYDGGKYTATYKDSTWAVAE
jgi:type IV pilus assembly protein PilA